MIHWKKRKRYLMPPNTLRVHTEYALVKSVSSKVLWAVAAEATGAGNWRMFPSPPVPCLLEYVVSPSIVKKSNVSSRLWKHSFLPFGKDTTTTREKFKPIH
ncbi:hypothetical protein TNCV_4616161 [Trichonephila clavipes]|nr:hypothetical protein TNCV_4616161 [Trichonephila clavipes]